jgi:hypothetical protein
MNLTFTFKILKQESTSSSNKLDFTQEILTNDFDSNEFKTYNYFNKDYNINKSRGDQIHIEDIFDFANILREDCSFIYMFIKDSNSETENENDINFTIKLGEEVITCSQFLY